MKDRRLRRPTLAQKKKMAAAGLRWENWLVSCEDNAGMTLVSRQTGKRRHIFT